MDSRTSILAAHFLARHSRTLFFTTVIYGTVCAVALALGWGGERVTDLLGAWGSLPIVAVICALLWPVMHDSAVSRRRRIAWRMVFVAQMLDLIASAGWGYGVLADNVSIGAWPDLLYVFFYPLV